MSNVVVPLDIALSTYALVAALLALVGAPLNVNAPVSVPPASGNTVAIFVSVYRLAVFSAVSALAVASNDAAAIASASAESAYVWYAVIIAVSLVSVYAFASTSAWSTYTAVAYPVKSDALASSTQLPLWAK